MAVLMIGEIPGQTEQGYEGMVAALGAAMKRAPGYLLHMAHPTEDGWRLIELWRSEADATEWFAQYVAPNLPPGIRPKRTFYEIHSIVASDPVLLALEAAASAATEE